MSRSAERLGVGSHRDSRSTRQRDQARLPRGRRHGRSPLLLLHGRTANHNDWNGFTQHFARRFHVFAPDLRGHGASDYPGSYDMHDMAEDVAALLDHLGVDRLTVVAHSLGAVVACLLAVARPDLVGRLVLEDPPPGASSPTGRRSWRTGPPGSTGG
ncbi:alpha/beta fold hydrolase [Nonomuraea antimicrobica]